MECVLPDDRACQSDRIRDTIDYDQLVDCLRALAMERHYNLVEGLAEYIATTLRQKFAIPWLTLTLIKTAPLPGCDVGVTIERGEL